MRRPAQWDRRNKMGVIKGYTMQRQERRLSVSKHIIVEDDDLSDHAESDGQSGMETASMLCSIPHEKLLEVVQHCPASMLQQFMPNVAAPVTPAVVPIPAGSCGWRVQSPGREPGQKRHAVFKFPFWAVISVSKSAKTDCFCVLRPHPV